MVMSRLSPTFIEKLCFFIKDKGAILGIRACTVVMTIPSDISGIAAKSFILEETIS